MPEAIENYIPQIIVKDLKKSAIKSWLIGLSIVFLWTFSIIFAPLAENLGSSGIAKPIYTFFSYLCHQMPERSFHLGNDPFAVCSRCFGVYFGLFLGFVIYPLLRKIEEIEPFSRIWLLLALIPIGIDWVLGVFGIWENTHWSRFLTGATLGAACAVFIIPGLVELIWLWRQKRQ